MRRFIGLVLFATVLFMGLGGVIEQVGARFKSDERALAILQKSRAAIGGDATINNVRSMTIIGKTTKNFEFDGVSRVEGGDVEINFELPSRMSKMVRIGSPEGGDKIIERKVDVVVAGDGQNLQWKTEGGNDVKRVVIKKKDGTEEVVTEDVSPVIVRSGNPESGAVTLGDGKKIVILKDDKGTADVSEDGKKVVVRDVKIGPEGMGRNPLELFRTTLALLLTAPEGLDVSYTYAGDGNVDGASCDVIDATVSGHSMKLYIDKSSSLPRMLAYQGHKPMMFTFTVKGDEAEMGKALKVFESNAPTPEMTEFQVKYSDYRTVGGLQLPFKWSQTVGGKADETTDVVSYEVNPANIAEKFKDAKVFVIKGDKTQK